MSNNMKISISGSSGGVSINNHLYINISNSNTHKHYTKLLTLLKTEPFLTHVHNVPVVVVVVVVVVMSI